MNPTDLVNRLLSEGLDPDDPIINKVMLIVQNYIGDVVGEETSEEEAREECWTLAIDAANDRIRDRTRAIAVASEVCHQMGYTPKGYRPLRRSREKTVAVWPPRAPGEDTTPPPTPTGVVRGPWKPDFV